LQSWAAAILSGMLATVGYASNSRDVCFAFKQKLLNQSEAKNFKQKKAKKSEK
jgi:hypothetical protein